MSVVVLSLRGDEVYRPASCGKELTLTSPIITRPYHSPWVLIDDLPPYEALLETLSNATRHLPLVVTVTIDTIGAYATCDGLFVSPLKKAFNLAVVIVGACQEAASFPTPVELRELSDGASAVTHSPHRES